MYKSIFAILLAGLLAAPAMAVPPPIGPGEIDVGWGINCDTWQYAEGFYQDWGLYNHDGWHLQWPMDPNHRRLFKAVGSIELWIELYAQMTCYNVQWQFHRISDSQFFFYFYVYGYVYSNSVINVEVEGGDLVFVDDKFGPRLGDDGGPISIDYAYASGDTRYGNPPNARTQYEIMQWYNRFRRAADVPFCILVGPSDWWWAFIGEACVPYHTEDGYYKLEMTVCPIPWL
jgi:hypothetical protein